MCKESVRRIVVMFTLATVCAAIWPAGPSAQEGAAGTPKITDLAWLAGDWQTPAGGSRQTDEHWTVPRGGVMMGMSRTVSGGKMTEFEYLRIVERADGIVYIAHPNARTPGTEFKLTKASADHATFENPEHDFPKRIIYRRNADGSITSSVDAGEGTRGPSFQYQPMRR